MTLGQTIRRPSLPLLRWSRTKITLSSPCIPYLAKFKTYHSKPSNRWWIWFQPFSKSTTITPPIGSSKLGPVLCVTTATPTQASACNRKPLTTGPTVYLIDTNIWLERLLDQQLASIVGEFLATIPSEQLAMSD